MNFKTKAIGLLAGSALALGLTTGAIAQNGSTDVLLEDGEGTNCTLEDLSANADFGTYSWDGTQFTADGTGVATITGTIHVTGLFDQDSATGDECTMSISGTDLTNANETSTIAVGNITYNSISLTTSAAVVSGQGSGAIDLDLTLGAFSSASELGAHEGDLTITTTFVDEP